MIFVLIRALPIVTAALFFILARAVFYSHNLFGWFFGVIIIINLAFFLLLRQKKQVPHWWLLVGHSLLFIITGLIYVMLISGQMVIVSFLALWSILLLVYLEAVFNYAYQTRKQGILDLRHIIGYLNAIIFFFGIATLTNLYFFLSLSWWWVMIGSLLGATVLLSTRFAINDYPTPERLLHTLVSALLITELVVGLLFWPISFYVMALLVTVAYYLLAGFSAASLANRLTKRLIIRYSVFAVIVIVMVLTTANWF